MTLEESNFKHIFYANNLCFTYIAIPLNLYENIFNHNYAILLFLYIFIYCSWYFVFTLLFVTNKHNPMIFFCFQPVGRPEADFTLDVPRSEHLLKRMKNDKKWRCRCRLLTSFFGLIFFLLSVMAVSLILTRGKRMFGSMV